MGFTWPLMLLAIALVPLLAAGYVLLIDQAGAVPLTERASGRVASRRRHVAPAFFLLAIALLVVSLARPTMVLALPHREGTVILAFDVSSSMVADDLKPTRLEAAKEAASAFVRDQPSTIRIGVVAFSESALITQTPTTVQADVIEAIDRLGAQGGTSVSAGMLTSLSAIADRPITTTSGGAQSAQATPEVGYFGSAVIVLLTDGEDTTEADPSEALDLVSGAGVRVDAIGIGTPDGATFELDGYTIATALNEPLLSDIATATGGTYFRAEDADKLKEIYRSVGSELVVRGERTEVTSVFAGAAMLLLLVGATLQLRWFGRAP